MKGKMGDKEIEELLIKGAKELGLDLTTGQVASFILYIKELKKWNRKVNLTRIIDDREIVIKHFLDSLAYTRGFAPRPSLEVIDVGTGAGFPGLPIKMAFPDINLTLLEATRKKTVFLHHICQLLNLKGVKIINDRLERINQKKEFINKFNIFLTRALAKTQEVAGSGLPLLRPGGLMIMSRGPDVEEERRYFLKKKDLDSGSIKEIISLILPFSNYKRNLIIIEKA